MPEINIYNGDEVKEKTSEEIRNNEKNIEEGVQKLKKIAENQNIINIEQRIDETFGDLDGQKFDEGNTIEFMYMSENGEKNECLFDIDNQSIEYKGIIYKIDMPKGANLDSIEFKNGEIIIVGSVGWFSGEGKTSYKKLYKALEKVFDVGYVEIATANGESLKIKPI